MQLKQKIRNGILVLGILSVATGAFAETDMSSSYVADSPKLKEFTLDESIQRALDFNPDLKALRNDVDIAYGEVIRANTFTNPEASYSVKDPEASGAKSNIEYGIEKEFQIGAWGPNRRAAKSGHAAAKEDLRSSEQEIIRDVKNTFYSLLSFEGKIELAEAVFKLNDELAQVARARYKRGEVSEVEANILEVERDSFIQEKKSLEAEYYEELLNFKNLLGQNDDEKIKLKGESYERNLDRKLADYLTFGMEHRPELLSAKNKVKQTKAEAKLAKVEAFPPVTLGYLWEQETSGEKLIGGKVSIPIPIFNQNRAEIHQTKAANKQAEAQEQSAQLQVQREIKTNYKNLKLLEESIDIYEKKMGPKLEKTLEIYKAGFLNGQVSIFEIVSFQKQYFGAKSEYLSLLNEYNQTAAELERVIGGKFETINKGEVKK